MIRFLSFICLLALSASFTHGEDWPRWRGPRGDGTWQAPLIAEKFPSELPLVWRQKLGPGYSGVSVAEGKVITLDRPAEPAEHERVVCFAAGSGEMLWQQLYAADYKDIDYKQGPRSQATIHAGRVYTLGAVGHLHCLDLASGEVLWQHDLLAENKMKLSMWGLAASPLIIGDQVIVHAGLPKGCYSSYDRVTGKELWRSGDDPSGYATPRLIRHAGEDLLIGWTPLHVVALSPSDGRELWKVPYEVTYGVSIADPIIQEGIVLVCGYWEGTKAIKLGDKPTEAKLLWEENKMLRGIMSQPLYRDGYVYLLDKQHGLVCFRLADGKVQWTDENRLTKRDRNPQASLVRLRDSDRALALNAEGQLVQLRLTPEKYVELSRVQLVKPTWAHPAYAGEYVYARDDEQIVCAKLTR
jgi:outer membrane protein assembly factor BamB